MKTLRDKASAVGAHVITGERGVGLDETAEAITKWLHTYDVGAPPVSA